MASGADAARVRPRARPDPRARVAPRGAGPGELVVQRYPCQETDHETSAEHRAIEVDYTTQVNQNGAREFEVPEGSVLTDENGRHKTGYVDLVDRAQRHIYDIKRADEGYPQEQLGQYLQAANAHCRVSKDWTLGSGYPVHREIAFGGEHKLIAAQGNAGVISYTKVSKGQSSLLSLFGRGPSVPTQYSPEQLSELYWDTAAPSGSEGELKAFLSAVKSGRDVDKLLETIYKRHNS
jgi:hypothetical protein